MQELLPAIYSVAGDAFVVQFSTNNTDSRQYVHAFICAMCWCIVFQLLIQWDLTDAGESSMPASHTTKQVTSMIITYYIQIGRPTVPANVLIKPIFFNQLLKVLTKSASSALCYLCCDVFCNSSCRITQQFQDSLDFHFSNQNDITSNRLDTHFTRYLVTFKGRWTIS